MNDDVETFFGSRRNKIAPEQSVVRLADLKRVFATRIPFLKPLLADRIWNIQIMKFVGHIGLADQ